MAFRAGQRVSFGDTETDRDVVGWFIRTADPDEALEIPLERGRRKADAAWVELEDGTVTRAVYSRLRPLPEDPERHVRQYDPALLLVLHGEGSMEFEAFVRTVTFAREPDDWPLPPNAHSARAWLRDAVDRGLVKHDEEGWVDLTSEGRNRLREFA